jgi:hypothetical protein
MFGAAVHQPCVAAIEADVGQSGDLPISAMQVSDLGSSAPSEDEGGSIARPKTKLQSGIRKPKAYTNAIIKYGCFTSTGEP